MLYPFCSFSLFCCVPAHKHHNKKIVVAYRGASGYLPEHTMESIAVTYAMQPDYIEQDVVLSKDNVSVVIHDIRLNDASNIVLNFLIEVELTDLFM